MEFHPDRPARRSIRLQTYDYADEGAYFVTLCTAHRECLFGEVVNGEMHLSDVGKIVLEEWTQTAIIRPNVELDAFVIMPNHVHGIIVITKRRGDPVGRPDHITQSGHISANETGRGTASPLQKTPLNNQIGIPSRPKGPPKGSLGAIIGQFKSSVSRRLKDAPDIPSPLWQRNYYEHVIRDEKDLNRIRAYIENNPQMWETDEENPARWMQKA